MVVTISGGIFNFTNNFYSAPTSTGTIYNFIGPIHGVRQIYNDRGYYYVIHNKGLLIYDIISEKKYAYIDATNFSTITGNDTYVYIGTTSSGLKRLNKTCIHGNIASPYNISNCIYDYVTYPYIEDNRIDYIHANGDHLGLITTSGTVVKGAKIDNQGYVSTATISGGITATKCYITSKDTLYYLVSGTEWSVDRAKVLSDWSSPAASYPAGGSIFASGTIPTDIYVTEGTSSDGESNTLFVATTSGVYVIDEGSNDHIVYYSAPGTSSGTNYFVLYGINEFNAIWADADASITKGKFYVTSSGYLNIVDNNTNTVFDYYSTTRPGRAAETLAATDNVDIGVSYGI